MKNPTDGIGGATDGDTGAPPPRFYRVSRRSLLGGAAGMTIASPLLAACGVDDEESFRGSDSTSSSTSTTVKDSDTPDELTVAFEFAATGGRRFHNPYIAAWIEDANGELVQTLALWFEQSRHGRRWLDDLRRWYPASGGDTSVSGATRTPGSYTLAWDGASAGGSPAPVGNYTVLVEAAREHGPYSLISADFEWCSSEVSATLSSDGELVGGAVRSA